MNHYRNQTPVGLGLTGLGALIDLGHADTAGLHSLRNMFNKKLAILMPIWGHRYAYLTRFNFLAKQFDSTFQEAHHPIRKRHECCCSLAPQGVARVRVWSQERLCGAIYRIKSGNTAIQAAAVSCVMSQQVTAQHS
eukprot:6186094-Pleurochrysis_carterae.AAC.5